MPPIQLPKCLAKVLGEEGVEERVKAAVKVEYEEGDGWNELVRECVVVPPRERLPQELHVMRKYYYGEGDDDGHEQTDDLASRHQRVVLLRLLLVFTFGYGVAIARARDDHLILGGITRIVKTCVVLVVPAPPKDADTQAGAQTVARLFLVITRLALRLVHPGIVMTGVKVITQSQGRRSLLPHTVGDDNPWTLCALGITDISDRLHGGGLEVPQGVRFLGLFVRPLPGVGHFLSDDTGTPKYDADLGVHTRHEEKGYDVP